MKNLKLLGTINEIKILNKVTGKGIGKSFKSVRGEYANCVIGNKLHEYITDKRGSHFVEVLVMILVVIIVGGLVLTFSSNALDEIGPLVINKIKSLFSL